MADLVIYGVPGSPFVRKVEVVLQQKGLEYDLEIANILPMPDWLAKISPAKRIPVLRDRRIGTEGIAGTIPDSSAICAFLERLAPTPSLYPADPFAYGRAVWLEEYADSELAGTIGMGIFRPIMFPLFQGKESDVDTARKTWHEKLPRYLDYLEQTLDGQKYFLGDSLSIADVSIVCQISQVDMIAGSPDKSRWPHLISHFETLKESLPGLKSNLTACANIFKRMLPEKIDLS